LSTAIDVFLFDVKLTAFRSTRHRSAAGWGNGTACR